MATYNSEQTERMREVHGARLAPFWRRAAGFLLDIVIMSLLFVAVGTLFEPLLRKHGWMLRSSEGIVFALNANWYSIAWMVLYFGLATYFGRGKTPGKALLGIRVVSLAHERLSLWHSVERALGYGASMLEFGFGFLQYFIHPNKRTVHDRIAETIVVRDPRGKETNPRPKKSHRQNKRKGKISLLNALLIDRDLENAIIESKYSEIAKSEDIEVNSLVKEIIVDTERHRDLLEKKIAAIQAAH